MAFEEFTGELDGPTKAVSFVPFDGKLDEPSTKPVKNAEESPPYEFGDASGVGDFSSIMAVSKPKRESVLEGMQMPEPEFNADEAVRLSNRKYAEANDPANPISRAPVMREGQAKPVDVNVRRGAMLSDSSMPVRAAAKAVSGGVQGLGGIVRAVGDVTGLDDVARFGKAAASSASNFDVGMGNSGPVEGFGPKSPVPYLKDMAEGAASSLGQSAALGAMFGAKAVIPAMSLMTAGQEYQQARDQGLDPSMALAGAVPKGIFEAVGEKFTGLDKVAGAMGTLLQKGASDTAKRTAGEILVRAGIKEIPGEVITYLGQTGTDLIPGIGLKPDMTMQDFVDGLRDTVVQAGMMGGVMAGGGHAAHTGNLKPLISPEDLMRQKWGPAPDLQPKPDPVAEITKAATVDDAITAAKTSVQSTSAVDAIGNILAAQGLTTESTPTQQAQAAIADIEATPAETPNVSMPTELSGVPAATDGGGLSEFNGSLDADVGTGRVDGPAVDAGSAGDQSGGGAVPLADARNPSAVDPRLIPISKRNVQDQTPTAGLGTEATAPAIQADAPVDSNAAPAQGLPGAGSAQVAADGLKPTDQRLVPVSKRKTSPAATVITGKKLDVVREFPSAATADGAKAESAPMPEDLKQRIAQEQQQATEEKVPKQTPATKQNPVQNDVAPKVELGKQVSLYTGKFGKGMGKDAARLEAQRLNRANADKRITYTAEEHNDPKLENPYAVVGRNAVEQKPAKSKADKGDPGGVNQSATLSPVLSAKLQEAHKAHGRDVTLATVQKMYDRVMKSLITGKGSNGGVQYDIKPKERKELQAQADRLTNDLSLFGEQKQPVAIVEPAQAATETVAPKKVKKPQGGKTLRSAAYDKNPLMTFLATHGLFHDKAKPNSHKSEFSPDKGIMVMGYGPVFKKTGKRLDALTQNAIEEGYLPKDGTESQLRELIRRAVAGEKISPLYAEGVAEQLAEQTFAEHLAQQQEAAQDEDFDPFQPLSDLEYSLEDAANAGYDEASDPIKLEVNALLALAEDQGIDTDSIKEKAANATYNDSEQAYYEAAKSALQAAIEGSNGDSRQDAGRQGAAPEGLTAPTRADVLAQQDRAEAATKAETKAATDSANKAKADADRNEFTLTGSDRAADVAAAGGQQDIFSAPTDPFKITDTRARRAAVLEVLGEGWKASDGIEGAKDLFKKRAGSLEVTVMPQKTVDGNFYVGSYDHSTKRGSNDSTAKTLDDAMAIADKLLRKNADPVAETKATLDANNVTGKERLDVLKDVKAGTLTAEEVKEAYPTKIEDAGEKIGGARKDRWKDRGLDLTDLDGMSESEGAELATKANVWKPDYDAMAEATEPVTAAMVKTVYDQLAAQPKKNTPEGRRNYVTMMQAVRKAYSEAKSPEDVKQAGDKVKRAIGIYTDDPEDKKLAREVLFSVYKGRSDPFVLGYNELSKAKKMVEDGFPAKGEPWKKRLTLRAYSATGFTPRGIEITLDESAELGTPLTKEQVAAGFYRINAKDGKAVGYAPTKADAEATAKTIYERDLKKGASDKAEPSRPNLDAMKREGLPKRTDRDVSADDFVKDFGFRGVEFGNWAAQDERQRIINMAYDGLMDLAEIMGVPPKALSLNGTMGMAFGARGGGKFAAHYEPGKLVINMTKINGGGSMAHEWAHAMDHYFGELNQKDAYTTKARGASGWYDKQQYKGLPRTRMEKDAEGKWANVTKMRLDNMRPEMAKAFDEVMSALFSGQETKAQMVRSEELAIERYQTLADKEPDPEMKAVYLNGIKSRQQALEELRKDPEDKMYPKGRSSYASQAQALSGKSTTGYWLRPTEMFARAFESWVFDKVAAMGAKSDYLVHGVEEDRFAGGGYKGNPYPTGQERATINAAFDKLASTIKTKETDKGVAMFARGAPQTEAFRKWFGDSKVVDADGKPLIMYHGTPKGGFKSFEKSKNASNYNLMLGDGFYFTPDKSAAEHYTRDAETADVLEVYLSIKKPLVVDSVKEWRDTVLKARNSGTLYEQDQKARLRDSDLLQELGYDGIVYRVGVSVREVVAFNPNQIKSATGNNGNFDPANPDIRYALGADAFRLGITPRKFMPVADVQKAVDQLKAKWTDGPHIKVVTSPDELPVDAPSDARGLIHEGTVYIVAGNHLDLAGVARTLAHEAIGHYGLWKMLGADGRRQFETNLQLALKSGNKPLNAIAARVRELYVDDNGKFNLSKAQEANEIAAFAVEEALDADGNFKPGFGFVKSIYAKVAEFLRGLGFDIKFTNAELQGMLVNSMRGLEAGKRLEGGIEGLVAAAQGGRPDLADPKTGISSALLELGKNEDLYRYPRSDALSLEHIAEDKGSLIAVSDVDRNTGDNKLWMVANTTPKDNAANGTKSWILKLPNGKLSTLTKKGNEVYINVSGVGEGNMGSAIYDLAANYALNNGLVFVGDPNGVSKSAMRRRLENMLSSAVKYGTTDHLEPHPDQYIGNADIGVPPLDWTKGDTLGNIRNMVDVSVAATKHLNPDASENVRFDPATSSFVDAQGRGHDALSLAGVFEDGGRTRGLGEGGDTTLRRHAIFKSLLQSVGNRSKLVESLHSGRSGTSSGLGNGLEKSFYARGEKHADTIRSQIIARGSAARLAENQSDSGKPSALARGTAATSSENQREETSPWRDATGRMQFAPGAWLYDQIGKAAGPMLVKMGMKAASPELRRQLRQMKLDVAKAQETAVAIARETSKLSDAERTMVSDLVEQELKVGVIPPEHAVRLAAMINDAMGRQTDELMNLGMLTKDSADKWRGKYLPRYYASKLQDKLGDAWADALRRLNGRQSVMKGIKGKNLKGRGLYETIPEDQLANYEALGWEVRDPDYTPSLPTVDGTVQVWRDFTPVEREKMGEIRDAGFRFVMGYMQTQRDIALGRMFERMAQDPEQSSRLEKTGYVQVPATVVKGTGAKVYGKLAGRWVPTETMSQLSNIEESTSEAWQMYRKAMAIWKEGKTALNPVSHVNNMVSNLTMAHLAGVSYHRGDKYLSAARDFVKKSPMMEEAKDNGLFLGTLSDSELMNSLPEELKILAQKQESKGEKIGRTGFNIMTMFLRKPMGAAYQSEDTFFRYLIYKDAREHGMEPQDAVDYAQKYIFTYDDLPKWARRIRDFGLPFFSYTYKAVPALLHTALTHPLRMAGPAAVLWAVNAAAYAIAAGDDDDSWEESLQKYLTDPAYRDKVREKEKLEREHLPPWMKGTTALMTPKTLRLGMDEVTKLPLFIDISRIIPGGDLFDISPNAGGIPLPQPITPSHPIFTTMVAMLGNKDLFLGKDLVDSNDTRGEAAEKRAAWLWRQMTPAITAGNYHFERGMNALAQANGGEISWMPDILGGDATGIGRDGNPVQPKYAAMQTFGIKVRPIDLDTAEAIDGSMKKKMLHDIDTELNKLKRLAGKGAISERTMEKERDLAQEKKNRLREGLTVDGDAKD